MTYPSFVSGTGWGYNSASSNNYTFSFTVSSNPNRILIVFASLSAGNQTNYTVTYGGTSCALVANTFNSANWEGSFWILVNPPTGAANVVITYTPGGNDYIGGAACEYQGAAQSGQPDNGSTTSDSGSNQSYTSSFTPNSAGCTVVAAAFTLVNTSAPTTSSPFTARVANSNSDGYLLADANDATTGSVSFTSVGSAAPTYPTDHYFVSILPASSTCPETLSMMGIGCAVGLWGAKKIEENPILTRRNLLLGALKNETRSPSGLLIPGRPGIASARGATGLLLRRSDDLLKRHDK